MRRIALDAFSHHFVFDQLVVDVVSWRLKAQKNSDCFSYQVTFKFQVDTKRKTLSETPGVTPLDLANDGGTSRKGE